MNNDVINCIPSKTMREYLTANPIDLNVLQEATIVLEYAKKEDYLLLFESLLEKAKTESERLLLASYVEDLRRDESGEGHYSDATLEIYEKEFPHDGFPLYPFLEVCGLPVLFREGDVIRQHGKGNTLYYVGFLPSLPVNHCDFSDECYLCYPLLYPMKTEEDLINSHGHIHLCEAEKASKAKLTPIQKNIYGIIRKLHNEIKKGE
ncbi:MAG: hypothetical protein IJM82_08865 [Synergistaceae bacterium]|nr:hypothetical protein [Synergistaceae bacterium]MBR0079016.1 hypothetical protein [Synergistaceae bacterium]MBR0253916.1 hypothetical protein [Synergistaceae bacterium]